MSHQKVMPLKTINVITTIAYIKSAVVNVNMLFKRMLEKVS